MIGAKLLAVVVCVQPLLVLFPISNTTNDTARGRTAKKLILFVPVSLIVLAAVVVVFMTSEPLMLFAGYVILLLVSVLLFAAYRRAYQRGKFDLLTERSPHR